MLPVLVHAENHIRKINSLTIQQRVIIRRVFHNDMRTLILILVQTLLKTSDLKNAICCGTEKKIQLRLFLKVNLFLKIRIFQNKKWLKTRSFQKNHFVQRKFLSFQKYAPKKSDKSKRRRKRFSKSFNSNKKGICSEQQNLCWS